MNPAVSNVTSWLLTLVPILSILWIHFRNQRKAEYFSRTSNYWIIFYIAGYYLPIPLFVAGEDGWSVAWGYSFSNFTGSLIYAVILATVGGIVLSLAAAPRRRRQSEASHTASIGSRTGQVFAFQKDYQIKWLRVFAIMAVSLGCLFVGVQIVGGLANLLANLGDRITLFAGINAFFLPVNLMIGVCFVLSALRVTEGRVSAFAEWMTLGITLPALFLLGQKSNLFILLVGIAIIKLMPLRDIKMRWVALSIFALPNLLMLYEFIFRDALINGIDSERLTLSGWSTYMHTQITSNFMQIQNLTVLVDAVPKIQSYLLGDTYLAFFQLLVPQSLIGIKPLTGAGMHTLAFWPEVVARETTTMPPGFFGEAYFNFGVPGYLVLCLFTGLILRMIDRPFQSGKKMNCMVLVSIATFGSMSLHFIRGEYFSPFLIFVGIFVGARLVVSKLRPLSKYPPSFSSNVMARRSGEELS